MKHLITAPTIKIFVTHTGCKYIVDMPIESPVRLQREICCIAETIGEEAEKVDVKPQHTFGSILIRFSRLPNRRMKISIDYKVASVASSQQQAIVLELYESLVEAFSENAV